jgi:hypothetical protein
MHYTSLTITLSLCAIACLYGVVYVEAVILESDINISQKEVAIIDNAKLVSMVADIEALQAEMAVLRQEMIEIANLYNIELGNKATNIKELRADVALLQREISEIINIYDAKISSVYKLKDNVYELEKELLAHKTILMSVGTKSQRINTFVWADYKICRDCLSDSSIYELAQNMDSSYIIQAGYENAGAYRNDYTRSISKKCILVIDDTEISLDNTHCNNFIKRNGIKHQYIDVDTGCYSYKLKIVIKEHEKYNHNIYDKKELSVPGKDHCGGLYGKAYQKSGGYTLCPPIQMYLPIQENKSKYNVSGTHLGFNYLCGY